MPKAVVCSVVNMKGGVGKTSVAINLAHALSSRRGKKTLVIDVDPQFNATQCLVEPKIYQAHLQKNGPTVAEIFDLGHKSNVSLVRGKAPPPTDDLASIESIKIRPGMNLLYGDLQLYRLQLNHEAGLENRLKRYLEKSGALDKFDFVIIDTPPTPSIWMTAALLASDCYIIPLKAEPLSNVGIDILRSVIKRFNDNYGTDIECLGIVLTMVEASTITYADTLSFLNGDPVWKPLKFVAEVPKRLIVAKEQGHQHLFLEITRHDAAAVKTALVSLTDEFLNRLGTHA
jgi:chromosome partitioning protein